MAAIKRLQYSWRVLEQPEISLRELAYILHRICETKGWTQEALPYNSLVVGWPEIARIASGQALTKGDRRLESFGEPGT